MKCAINYMFAMLAALFMSGCFADNSSQPDEPATDIDIDGIEQAYSCTAYVGQQLQIQPKIHSGYTDLQFQWLLYDKTTGTQNEQGKTIEPKLIGTTQNLNYEVAINPGVYVLRLKVVSASTQYTVYAQTTLTVDTNFSNGIYVLKAVDQNHTDVDLFANNGATVENVLQKIDGKPMEGAPHSLWTNYGQYYINPESNRMEATNTLCVITQSGNIEVKRTNDMATVFNRETLLYDPMESDEMPMALLAQYAYGTTLVTNKGIRYTNSEYAMFTNTPVSGKFGYRTVQTAATKFIVHCGKAMGGMVYWNPEKAALMTTNYNFDESPLLYKDKTGADITQNLKQTECVACGQCTFNKTETNHFVLRNTATGNAYVYLLNPTMMGVYLKKRITVPANSHMAQAQAYSTCALQAHYIYYIHDNGLYAYNFNNDDFGETPLNLEGLPNNENMVYVTNLYFNTGKQPFDYLVVGTQQQNTYKLYLYNMTGGVPKGKPIKTLTGNGMLKSVRYVSPIGCEQSNSYQGSFYAIND